MPKLEVLDGGDRQGNLVTTDDVLADIPGDHSLCITRPGSINFLFRRSFLDPFFRVERDKDKKN